MRILLYIFLILLSACSNEQSNEILNKVDFEVNVLFSPQGLGDYAYNDVILYGIQKSHKNNHFKLNILQPSSIADGWKMFETWKNSPTTKKNQLFIFTSVIYEKLLMNDSPIGNEHKQIILFQSEKEIEKVRTFNISSYGAAYFIGKLIGDSRIVDSAALLLANEEDFNLKQCNQGFMDGFLDNDFENDFETYYLAKHLNEGYNIPDSAYYASNNLFRKYRFVFPIAGGSNKGVYQSVRDNGKGIYTAGIDADVNNLASPILCSLVKRFDLIIEIFIKEWMEGEKMDGLITYDLNSEFVYVSVSPDYIDFFQPYLSGLIEIAKRKEHEYLESNK